MMVEKTSPAKRNKPIFLRSTWNKMHKLGKKVKSKRKWRANRGRDSKMRLKERGYARSPNVGWGADHTIKNQVKGLQTVRVETLKELENVPKGYGIFIGKVGKKKRLEIIAKANEKKITILNKYRTPKTK